MKRYWKHALVWALVLAAAMSFSLLAEGEEAEESYGRTTAAGVRLRKGPSTGFDYWFRLPENFVCAYSETETDSSGVIWYKVNIANPETTSPKLYTGYLHGSYFVPITPEEAAAAGVNTAGTAPTAAVTGTDLSGTPNGTAPTTSVTGTELRGTANGKSVIDRLKELTGLQPPDAKTSGETAPASATTAPASSGETAPASATTDQTVPGETAPASATTDQTAEKVLENYGYGYVKTKVKGVNLRAKPAGAIQEKISLKGTVLPLTGEGVSKQNYTWYPVQTAAGHRGYLRGDCVELCDAKGNALSSADTTTSDTSATTADTATTTPDTTTTSNTTTTSSDTGTETTVSIDPTAAEGNICGYVTTTKGSVNVRSKPAGKILGKVRKGLVFAYYEKKSSGGYTWYKVNTTFGLGYLRGDCVKETDKDGAAAETTVTTGTTGTADAQNYSDLSMTIYPAEKIDWFTGGIQELIPKGSNFKIYDVKTGIVWWAHRWSGGKHADIETLTAADTARLCKIYGVSSANKITDWQRRPCLITVGNRTFACALYGVPHNSSGDTIADNNLDGQICLHFTNSRTHGSNKVVSYNEEAIEYAWLNAPNGHK